MTDAARRAVAAIEALEDGEGFVRLDRALFALASLPKTECAFARALRNDEIWPERRHLAHERDQIARKELPARPQYHWLDPLHLVKEAERLAGEVRPIAESHLGAALVSLGAKGLAEYAVRTDRLLEALTESEDATARTEADTREPKAPHSPVDVFLCHAGEDKVSIARPIADALKQRGLSVWMDELELRLGDSLRQRIDDGLSRARFGVVVLSKSFFAKHWTQRELDGLVAKEALGGKVVLPVWHEVTYEQVLAFSPPLADRLAVNTSDGIAHVVDAIQRAVVDSSPRP